MYRRILATALAAVALPAAPAVAKTAHFKVSIKATQDVSWSEDIFARDCAGGVTETVGGGRSHMAVHTRRPVRVDARRERGRMVLAPRRQLKVAGTMRRYGALTHPGDDTGHHCGHVTPVERDCGQRTFPDDAQLSLELVDPRDWEDAYGPVPLGPALLLKGPFSIEWIGGPVFANCVGPGVLDYRLGLHAAPQVVFARTLFGHRRRLRISGSVRETVDVAAPGPVITSGRWPITTTIHWTVAFTRVESPGRGLRVPHPRAARGRS
jgi:hypothetical protein